MITEEEIDAVFNSYKTAFLALAEKEDELELMKQDLESLKEGSSKHVQRMEDIRKFESSLFEYQRLLRLAGLEIDRLKTKLMLEDVSTVKAKSAAIPRPFMAS
jgi:hypothetical protein